MELIEMGARWYDPQIGRWLSPDSIIPDYKAPQSFNRYTFVLNNPVKYRDPSGHQGCSGFGEICIDFWKPLREMWESAPEVAPEVAKEMVVDAAESAANSAKFVGNTVTPPAPDALVFGFSGSADLGVPGGNFSNDMGMEDVINLNTGEHTVFRYEGSGVSKGSSATLSAYGGLIWNLRENSDYLGSFESVNTTFAAGHGGTATYFWAPADEPGIGAFTSGNTKGFVIGYAPGAGGSVSYNQTEYFEVKSYPQISPKEENILERKPQHQMLTQRN